MRACRRRRLCRVQEARPGPRGGSGSSLRASSSPLQIEGDDMLAAAAQRLKTQNRKSSRLEFTSALREPSAARLAYTCGSMSSKNPSEGDDRVADFGYEQVPWSEKKARVRGVFDSV